jgi:hypothetical protein
MLGHAISNTFNDLATAIGWVGLGVIAYFLLAAVCTELFYLARGGKQGWERREAKKFPAELEALERQHRQQIRCIGGSRRGPERVGGPESRTDRLPFSGRPS